MSDNFTKSCIREQDTVVDVERVFGPISIALTLFANCLFLASEVKRRNRTNATTVNLPQALILFLSSADTAAILFGLLPVWILTEWKTYKWLTYVHCVCAYFLSAFFTLSQCLVVLISMEQFASICKPYLYIRHCSVSTLAGCLLCVSVYSMCVGVVPMLNALEYLSREVHYVLLFSSYAAVHYDYMIVGQDLVLVSILLFCNIRVIRTLKAMEANVAVSCINDRKAYMRQLDLLHGTGREISRMMAMISLVFLACCVPNLIRVVSRRFNACFTPLTDYVTWRLSFMTGVFNPFLYCLLRKRFRRTFRDQFRKRFICCRSNRIQDIAVETNDAQAKPVDVESRKASVTRVLPLGMVQE